VPTSTTSCNFCSTSGTTGNADCTLSCPDGFQHDAAGCKICKCVEKPVCETRSCAACTPDLGYIFDSRGCQTCECKRACPTAATNTGGEVGCTRYCPNGYARDANGCQVCECYCPEPLCGSSCDLYRVDEYGCKKCDCATNTCPAVTCDLRCEYGYVIDPVTNCKRCACNEKPLCDQRPCTTACGYGRLRDANGCESCDCNPCPQVLCFRYCENGYQTDPNTGCQTCLCNEKPNCVIAVDANRTNVAGVSFADVCKLLCTNGFERDPITGCERCVCRPATTECNCVEPANYVARKCSDGSSTFIDKTVCVKTADGKCAYRERRCPIIIVIRVDSELTEVEKAFIFGTIIRYSGTVSEVDIKIERTVDSATNKIEYRVSIQYDALPENDAKGETMARDIAEDPAVTNRGGTSFVLSDSSPTTSFASVIFVPIFGALISLLF